MEWMRVLLFHSMSVQIGSAIVTKSKKEHNNENCMHTVRPMITDTVNLAHLKFQSPENVWRWSEKCANELNRRERNKRMVEHCCIFQFGWYDGRIRLSFVKQSHLKCVTGQVILTFVSFFTAVAGILSKQLEPTSCKHATPFQFYRLFSHTKEKR